MGTSTLAILFSVTLIILIGVLMIFSFFIYYYNRNYTKIRTRPPVVVPPPVTIVQPNRIPYPQTPYAATTPFEHITPPTGSENV